MNNILVTGLAGFLGSKIARHFQQRGFRVVGIDSHAQTSGPWSEYVATTLPSADLARYVRAWQPSLCIHCAGPASVGNSFEDPAGDFQSSVSATYCLLDAVRREAPACRVIYLSSAAVYGNPVSLPIDESAVLQPISPYGFHKQMSESVCLEYYRVFGLRTAITRIFSAYGPGLRRQVVADICGKLLRQSDDDTVDLYGDGTESRDFIHVSDVVAAIDLISSRGRFVAEIYNLGSGCETTIRDAAHLLRDALRPERELRFTGAIRSGDPHCWCASIDKITALGFAPKVTLENGLALYAQWFAMSPTGQLTRSVHSRSRSHAI